MRMFMRALTALIVQFVVAVLIVSGSVAVAFAQGGGILIDDILAPLRPFIAEIVSVLILAIVGWVSSWLRSVFKITLDEKHRKALHSALENAARYSEARFDEAIDGKRIPVENELITTGVGYVLKYSPDAVRYFGLSPERVGELLKAKLVPPPGS